MSCTTLLARGYVHYWKRRRRRRHVHMMIADIAIIVCLDLDLDLDDSCQTAAGYWSNVRDTIFY